MTTKTIVRLFAMIAFSIISAHFLTACTEQYIDYGHIQSIEYIKIPPTESCCEIEPK